MILTGLDSLSPMQCRMARAGLCLSIDRTAEASNVSRASITRFENGNGLRPVLRAALRMFFERSGLTFTTAGVEPQCGFDAGSLAA